MLGDAGICYAKRGLVSLNNAGMTTVTCFADCMRAVHRYFRSFL